MTKMHFRINVKKCSIEMEKLNWNIVTLCDALQYNHRTDTSFFQTLVRTNPFCEVHITHKTKRNQYTAAWWTFLRLDSEFIAFDFYK